MHTEDLDEEDDKPDPGEVIATDAEVRQAVEAVLRNKALERRLLRAAYVVLQTTAVLRSSCAPEDLLADAVLAVLERRRKWRTNKVDLPGLLVGAMKSLAWSRERTMTTTMPVLVAESELAQPDSGDSPMGNLAVESTTPETTLIEARARAEEEAVLAILRAEFGPDELPGRIIDEIRKRQGHTHAEIRSALGVSDSAYWNARKAVQRAADNFNQHKE